MRVRAHIQVVNNGARFLDFKFLFCVFAPSMRLCSIFVYDFCSHIFLLMCTPCSPSFIKTLSSTLKHTTTLNHYCASSFPITIHMHFNVIQSDVSNHVFSLYTRLKRHSHIFLEQLFSTDPSVLWQLIHATGGRIYACRLFGCEGRLLVTDNVPGQTMDAAFTLSGDGLPWVAQNHSIFATETDTD